MAPVLTHFNPHESTGSLARPRPSGDFDRQRFRHSCSVAVVDHRRAAGGKRDDLDHRFADDYLRADSARVQHFSVIASGHHAVPTCAERRFDSTDSDARSIRAFGEFVAGNNTIVGLVLFVIIIVIQFVVITKGATRISEVAARFALDGMPGRQMAIDADLSNGVIDEHEAQRRRSEITQQADFFGAMDGASKFVRGDAIAGIIITLINIMGGLVIGVIQSGMSMMEAGEVFTKLTIGDGLVSQVPALLISLAAGLLVTRSSQKTDLPAEFVQQLFARPQSLAVTAVALGLLVFTDLPTFPLISISGSCAFLAVMLRRQKNQATAADAAKAKAVADQKKPDDRIEDYLAVDPMEIEIGVGLIRLADPSRGGDLLPRITGVRQTVASEIGIVLPKVRIRDNMRLNERMYRIKIANNTVAEGLVHPDKILAMETAVTRSRIQGSRGRDSRSCIRPAVRLD
jgi:flagellar biosynthesis protein FlhA